MAGEQEIINASSVQRKRKVDLHVRVPEEYGCSKHAYPNEFLAHESCHAQRLEGKKNVDLWVDARLYPLHPPLQATPPFRDLTSFLKFLGDGENGLLGYCKRLSTSEAHNIHF